MIFSNEQKDYIKSQVRLSTIVGRRVPLTSRNGGFECKSPFTNEKTASFFVNDDNGLFKCFSSGLGGDVITFVMEFEGVNFMDALKIICEESGIELETEKTNDYSHVSEMSKCVYEANLFFQSNLLKDCGKNAREYLRSRGLKKNSLDDFSLGYAPDSFNETFDHLKSKGFNQRVIVDSGLAILGDDKRVWDKFRNRVMFPIKNSTGSVVAFGGRSMSNKGEAKYLNSPETKIFHKKDILYNLSSARRYIKRNKGTSLIVVEGYMDAISLHESGIKNVVSTMGTAITIEQLNSMWKIDVEPIMCLDGDRSGRQASYRVAERSLPMISGANTVRFSFLPNDLDPDEYISKYGVDLIKEFLDNPMSMVDLIWSREKDFIPLTSPERKKGLKDRLIQKSNEIQDSDLRYYYKRELLSRFDKEIKGAWKANKVKSFSSRGVSMDSVSIQESHLSCLPIINVGICKSIGEKIESVSFNDLNAERLRVTLINCIDNNDYSNIDECVAMNLDEDELKYLQSTKKELDKIIPKDLTDKQIEDVWLFTYDRYKEQFNE